MASEHSRRVSADGPDDTQRSASELASYQKKIYRIDSHLGIAIAGLTSDARVLSSV